MRTADQGFEIPKDQCSRRGINMSERHMGSFSARPLARAGMKDEAGELALMTKLGLVDVTFWPVPWLFL